MPKAQILTDTKTIKKYDGKKMYFAPPYVYDAIMKKIPKGKLITVNNIRDYLANQNDCDFTEPITARSFISIAAWASEQRKANKTPYWRTLKAKGELNSKYLGGIEKQKPKLVQEGHEIIKRGRTNIRYYVKDYEANLYKLQS